MRTTLAFGTERADGQVTRTWADPCPVCGGQVTSLDAEAVTVRDNPEAVLALPDPACRYDHDDPDSPDCTCSWYPNSAPPAWLDEEIVVGWRYTLWPCGHEGQVTIYTETGPEPGTLGELMARWAEQDD
jgi:hypothetical protein